MYYFIYLYIFFIFRFVRNFSRQKKQEFENIQKSIFYSIICRIYLIHILYFCIFHIFCIFICIHTFIDIFINKWHACPGSNKEVYIIDK